MTRAMASVIPTVLTAVLAAALAGCGDESGRRDRSGPREPAAIGSSTAPGVKARFVRAYSNGSTAEGTSRFTEVEVHGVRAGP